MSVIVPCTMCGKWYFANNMEYVKAGKRIQYYCKPCVQSIKENGGFNHAEKEHREQRI